jgi:hypothetical protein
MESNNAVEDSGGGAGEINDTIVLDNVTYCWNEEIEHFTWCPSENILYNVSIGKTYCIAQPGPAQPPGPPQYIMDITNNKSIYN